MQRNPEQERSRKRRLLLLLPLLLPAAGLVLAAVNSGDDQPGSDVLALNLSAPPTTEQAGTSIVSPGAPVSSTVKGSGKSTSSSGDSVGATAKPGGADPNPPQSPSITSGPDDPTFATSAQFNFAGKQSGLGFRCSLDGAPYSSCNSGTSNYNKLSVGEHTFRVVAVDSSGRVSAPSPYTWTILVRREFEITGSLNKLLSPGTSDSLNLFIGNPFNFPLKVLSVQVTVEAETTKNDVTNKDCIGTTNLSVVHGLTTEVIVPAHSTLSLEDLIPQQRENWPLIQMLNLSTNQDACKNTTFKLSYEGTGTKA